MQIEMYGTTRDELSELFKNELDKLSHLKSIYNNATTIQKHELIKLVFDNGLHYKNCAYRTHFSIETLHVNALKTNILSNLITTKKGENNDVFSLGAPDEIRTHIVGTGNRNSIH